MAQQGSMPLIGTDALGAAETMLQQGSRPSGWTETRIAVKSACTGCPGFSVESNRRSATWNSKVRPVLVSRAVTTPEGWTATMAQQGSLARDSAVNPSSSAAIDNAASVRMFMNVSSEFGDLAVLDQCGVALAGDFDADESDR